MSEHSAGDASNPLVGGWWFPPVEQMRLGLSTWVQSRLGSGVHLGEAEFPTDGHSSVNVVFRLDGGEWAGRYVARMVPPDSAFPMFPKTDLTFQKACMDVVRTSTRVPAPEVLWHEEDVTWLGAPFLVMRFVPGESWPTNPPYTCEGWVYESLPEQRAAMQEATVEVLAELHSIDELSTDLRFLEDPELGLSGVQHCLEYSQWYYNWAHDGVSYPLLEDSLQWLNANRPRETSANVLSWGDARPGNILFQDQRISAVLDWEMAALGPREIDLGFLVLFHRYFDLRARAVGSVGLPRLFRADDVVATYERASGHVVDDLTWYQMFAAIRISIHHVRQIARAVAFGRIERPADASSLLGAKPLLEEFLTH